MEHVYVSRSGKFRRGQLAPFQAEPDWEGLSVPKRERRSNLRPIDTGQFGGRTLQRLFCMHILVSPRAVREQYSCTPCLGCGPRFQSVPTGSRHPHNVVTTAVCACLGSNRHRCRRQAHKDPPQAQLRLDFLPLWRWGRKDRRRPLNLLVLLRLRCRHHRGLGRRRCLYRRSRYHLLRFCHLHRPSDRFGRFVNRPRGRGHLGYRCRACCLVGILCLASRCPPLYFLTAP
mmetsp:Transcript_8478/g.26241  ORF Transcript_8478/g.26241 Transcript_8478/m.26241 type:complete len:230 (-) Transcript_8478:560-1249(-)